MGGARLFVLAHVFSVLDYFCTSHKARSLAEKLRAIGSIARNVNTVSELGEGLSEHILFMACGSFPLGIKLFTNGVAIFHVNPAAEHSHVFTGDRILGARESLGEHFEPCLVKAIVRDATGCGLFLAPIPSDISELVVVLERRHARGLAELVIFLENHLCGLAFNGSRFA